MRYRQVYSVTCGIKRHSFAPLHPPATLARSRVGRGWSAPEQPPKAERRLGGDHGVATSDGVLVDGLGSREVAQLGEQLPEAERRSGGQLGVAAIDSLLVGSLPRDAQREVACSEQG